MAINKIMRAAIYDKYQGHCAYCGKAITHAQMQVDLKTPRYHWDDGNWPGSADDIDNLMPACAHCNHYKGCFELDSFRTNLLQLDLTLSRTHKIRVAMGYGIVTLQRWDGLFFFEKNYTQSADYPIGTDGICGSCKGTDGDCALCETIGKVTPVL